MDITELEQYSLKDAVQLHRDLNPQLFLGDQLKPDVRRALLRIADDFREYLGLNASQIDDITVSGSNAGYTYTPYSDIDLHLIIDMKRLDNDEVYRELFDAKKSLYNDRYDIKVKNADVELYVQGAADQHHSAGVYSLTRDQWQKMPRRQRVPIDDNTVQAKYNKLGHAIEQAVKNPDYDKLSALLDKIKRMRKAGLDRAGEFSSENLVFKLLRNRGLIKRLIQARDQAKSDDLSIEEAAYAGNIGIMELNEFYRKATPEQKKLLGHLIKQGQQREIWDLVKRVTGMEIMTEFRWGFQDEPLQEAASGYIPSEAERDDPRFSNALTVDIRPDSLKKAAQQLGFKISRAGVPPRARTNGKLTEGRVAFRGVDSRLSSEINRAIPNILRSLELKPDQVPSVTFTSDRSWAKDHTTFGVTQWKNTADDSQVYVYVGDRYLADVLRTYTHELQHVKQFINGVAHHDMDSRELAQVEADANTVAGRVMVDYGKQHNKIFTDLTESYHNQKSLDELAVSVKKLSNPNYDNIDAEMQRIAKKYSMTAKQLHDQWVAKYGVSPDAWVRGSTTEVLDEDQDLLEVKMSSGELEKLANCVKVSEGSGMDQTAGIGIDGESFRFNIKDLIDFAAKYPTEKVDPTQFHDQIVGREEDPAQSQSRVAKADLEYPIIVVRRKNGTLWIADGTHRAHKAILTKQPAIRAKIIPVEDMSPFSVDSLAEDQDLLEVKMSPGELEKWANSEEAQGIQAGFEAELIFRDTSRDDDEGESEPDMDADQRADSIESVVDFFMGGDNGIGRNTANRLRDQLYEELYDWALEQIDQEWEREAEDQVREWMRNNISPNEYRDQAVEELGIDSDQPSEEQLAAIDQRAAELFDQAIDSAIENQDDNYDRAREQFNDYRRDDTDYDEESFLSDRYRYMSDIGDAFSLDWPYWTQGSSNSDGRTTEDIANSLSSALGGAEVRASSGYHSTSRKPNRWIIEPDGSLDPDDYEDAGLEVVSPPMPLPEALRSLRTVIDWANSDGDAYTNGSTGLHMGVSIPHKGGDVDYVKLILFMGDRYVLDQFGRSANSYTRSALEKLQDVQRSRRSTNEAEGLSGAEKTAAAMELMKRNLIELAQRYVQDGVGRDKYTSAHIKNGYIEFRSPGGDYLSMDSRDESALANTMLRFARAMYIAGRPDLERKEYAKKLYQLIDTQGDDALKLFMDYTTGRINQEELKKDWARQVLAKEQPRKVEQEYEVYDKNTGKTLETLRFARGEGEGMVSAAIANAIEKYSGQGMDISLRQAGEPEVEISRRAKVAKKISDRPTVYRVEAGDQSILVQARDTEEAKQRAREQDNHFMRYRTISVTPATAEEIKQYQAQARDNAKDRQDIQQRVQGQSQEQRYLVQWTERRNGREVSDSLRVTARNADAAMASVRSALEAQGRRPTTISADTAPIPGSTLDLAQQRAQQATTGARREYQIYQRDNNVAILGFMAANDEEAMARLRRYRLEHPDADVGVRTGGDSMQTPAQQAQGEWTGHWIVQDGQGRELTRFHGIGNNQSDANRHAARWLGTNRPDLAGQEIEVVPEIR